MKSLIGEYSNYSSAYHNKCPKTAEQRAIYEGYIDQISVLTGKAIDQAKTGVIFLCRVVLQNLGDLYPIL